MPQADAYTDPYAERIAAQRALLAEVPKPRYTPEQIAFRRAENERFQQLGLLGQLSGDETLTPLAAQVLRQAQADRAKRVSDQGEFDPLSGQFTLHAEAQRDRSERELQRLQDAQADAQRAWQAGRQAAAERADAAELQRQFVASQNAANRAAASGARGAAQDARVWQVEDRMADDFTRDTKAPHAVLGAYKNLGAIASKADPASDIAFVYSYMRMLDPSSVVREGEFATAQNAAGVPDRVRNMYNQAMTGQRLNPQQRADMLATASRLATQAETGIDDAVEQYGAKALRRSLNPENVTGRPTAFPKTLGQPGGAGPGQQRYRVDY
jgi:hypothetical protein